MTIYKNVIDLIGNLKVVQNAHDTQVKMMF